MERRSIVANSAARTIAPARVTTRAVRPAGQRQFKFTWSALQGAKPLQLTIARELISIVGLQRPTTECHRQHCRQVYQHF